MMLDFRLIAQYLPDFFNALLQTLKVAIISGFFALIIGTILGVLSITKLKAVRVFIGIYNGFMRSTPLLVQLYMVHYGLPSIGIKLIAFQSAIIAFSLNTGSYISEIVRGGLSSIDKGQFEASKALGLGWLKMMQKVVLPQVFKRILPPLISQFSYLIKDTSLAAVLAIAEITYAARDVASKTYKPFESFGVPMLMYILIYLVFSILPRLANKKEGKPDGGLIKRWLFFGKVK
jgi:His/Glu/Gln/Arg/opine family amino acid ABC transporter permease subunit